MDSDKASGRRVDRRVEVEVLVMCLDKFVGRVVAVRKRVRAVEREDEAARARRAAERLERGEGVGDADADADHEGQSVKITLRHSLT